MVIFIKAGKKYKNNQFGIILCNELPDYEKKNNEKWCGPEDVKVFFLHQLINV